MSAISLSLKSKLFAGLSLSRIEADIDLQHYIPVNSKDNRKQNRFISTSDAQSVGDTLKRGKSTSVTPNFPPPPSPCHNENWLFN